MAFLVDITRSSDAYILGATDSFWTVAVSEHTPFRQIAEMVRKERVLSRMRGLHDGLRRGGWQRSYERRLSMAEYEDGRIDRLAHSLKKARIDQGVVDQIMQDGHDIRHNALPVQKSDWLRGAMLRMDDLLDIDTRRSVREACACCLGGKRLETDKAIARENDTLEARIAAANEARFVFGHSVTLQDDGRVRVCFFPEGMATYRCPCLPQAKEPLPISYCFCCGGHVKHHLQIALGRKMTCDVQASALSSGGARPCTFVLSFAD